MQRAYKTANAICLAQPKSDDKEETPRVEAILLPVLREQDFGSYEGRPFHARPRNSFRFGKSTYGLQYQDDPDFKDVESKEAMGARANAFLEEHIMPIIREKLQDDAAAIAVVSHGILLSHLWKGFLLLLPKSSVALSPGLFVGNNGVTPLEYLGGWSNTGYLELDIRRAETGLNDKRPSPSPKPLPSPESPLQPPQEISLPESCRHDTFKITSHHPAPEREDAPLASIHDINVVIRVVNGREHLIGLKRTKGGVGSSRHDESQKTIESFFKKRKL